MGLLRRPQYSAGLVLILIGIIAIGLGLSGTSLQTAGIRQNETLLGTGIAIVDAVLALLGYSTKN